MSAPRGLEVEGDLAFGPGSEPPSRLRAEGRRIRIDLASLRTARALASSVSGGARMTALRRALRHADLEVEARLNGWRVATLAPEGAGSWLGRLLGLPGVDVDWLGCARAALRRRR